MAILVKLIQTTLATTVVGICFAGDGMHGRGASLGSALSTLAEPATTDVVPGTGPMKALDIVVMRKQPVPSRGLLTDEAIGEVLDEHLDGGLFRRLLQRRGCKARCDFEPCVCRGCHTHLVTFIRVGV